MQKLKLTVLKLTVEGNCIKQLESSLFGNTSNLIEFNFGLNNLTFLPEIPDSGVRALRKVRMEGNPWQCLCLDEMQSWLAERNIDYIPIIYDKNPYFLGQKPMCMVTNLGKCSRDLNEVRSLNLVNMYL